MKSDFSQFWRQYPVLLPHWLFSSLHSKHWALTPSKTHMDYCVFLQIFEQGVRYLGVVSDLAPGRRPDSGRQPDYTVHTRDTCWKQGAVKWGMKEVIWKRKCLKMNNLYVLWLQIKISRCVLKMMTFASRPCVDQVHLKQTVNGEIYWNLYCKLTLWELLVCCCLTLR